MIPNVLSIAGSDPSGGAGIQADLKAISANRAYAMAAVTALTAQNTQRVSAVEPVPVAFVALQIDAVFADVRVDAVKIGMVGNAGVATAIADALGRNRASQVVLDPVMVAKGGDRLLAEDAVDVLIRRLLPLAEVLTPNLPEAAALLGMPEPRHRTAMPEIAHRLRALGPRNVFLKGGHLGDAESPDYLATQTGGEWLEGPRLKTRNTHGTGCTLSSALAAQLARVGDVVEACRRAKAYVTEAIAHADELDVGNGHGPTHHFHALWTR